MPVLWYLAGLTCTEETFAIKAGAQRVAAELGLVLVAPDTSPRVRLPGDDADWDFGLGAGFYVDATREPWSRHYRMYTYVTQELPAAGGGSLPGGASGTASSGTRWAGTARWCCALRNPQRYRSVSAFAPIAAPSLCPWGRKAFSGYLGEDPGTWAAYDASALAALQRFPTPILVDQGTADKFLAEQLLPQRLADACRSSGTELRLRMHDGYDHGYWFIQSFVEDHLRHHAALLRG